MEKSTFETLGDRLKFYESRWEESISAKDHIVIRIDGHKFSKYTKGFKRPFDEILSKAMEQTTTELVKEFQAVVGYTQSDEITLVIPSPKPTKVHYNKLPTEQNHAYNGRVQKMASLASGFATMAFNRVMNKLITEFGYSLMKGEYSLEDNKYLNDIEDKIGSAWFDARVYSVDSDIEAFNSVLWRVRDAEKNSRSMFAQAYCKHKDLQNMTGKEQVQFCLDTTGEDWGKVDDRYKYGILVKKEKYIKFTRGEDLNRFCGKQQATERTRLVSFSKHLTFSEENVEMIMNKFKET